MTLTEAFCKLLLAYRDQQALTVEELDEAFDTLPPEARVLRPDGVMDVKTALAITWRFMWEGPQLPWADAVSPEFAARPATPIELD